MDGGRDLVVMGEDLKPLNLGDRVVKEDPERDRIETESVSE